jgi:hypothetical protein
MMLPLVCSRFGSILPMDRAWPVLQQRKMNAFGCEASRMLCLTIYNRECPEGIKLSVRIYSKQAKFLYDLS